MQQWEYCRLYVWELKPHKEKGYSCNLSITYLGSSGEKVERLAEIDKQFFPSNPFEKAFGLLGSVGWELVSVHYGLYNELNGGLSIGLILNTNRAFAFFKRLVESDRAVDEPRLKI